MHSSDLEFMNACSTQFFLWYECFTQLYSSFINSYFILIIFGTPFLMLRMQAVLYYSVMLLWSNDSNSNMIIICQIQVLTILFQQRETSRENNIYYLFNLYFTNQVIYSLLTFTLFTVERMRNIHSYLLHVLLE